MRAQPLLLVALLVPIIACGSGTDDGETDGGPRFGEEAEGVYAIASWTENPADCESEGASILAERGETHVGVKATLSRSILVVTCFDPQDCRDTLDAGLFIALAGGVSLNQQEGSVFSADEPLLITSVGSGADATCSGSLQEPTLERTEAGVRLERRWHRFRDIPTLPDADGDGYRECDEDAARAAAAGVCELEVVVAAWQSELPPPSE